MMKGSNWRRIFLSLIFLVVLVLSGQPLGLAGVDPITPTSTSIPAFTPRPPDAESLSVLEKLAVENEDCTLPCLWGLQLRSATLNEVQIFVEQLGQELDCFSSERSNLSFCNFFLDLDPGLLSIDFLTDGDQVIQTKVTLIRSEVWLTQNPFYLPELLSTLGLPTDVYVKITGGDTFSVSLVVIYDDLGITVEYVTEPPGSDELDSSDPIMVCPQLARIRAIYVWLQTLNADFPIPSNFSPPPHDLPSFPYWPLEQMTDMDIQTFRTILIDPDGCIEIPSINTLRDAGYPW
jgi:hypothetical protein